MDGKIDTGHDKDYCRVLTSSEEDILVDYIKNKNRALQQVSRNELNKIIKNFALRPIKNEVAENTSLYRTQPRKPETTIIQESIFGILINHAKICFIMIF